MAQTGKERSLTVLIEKTIGGVMQPGYPTSYQGRNAFPGYEAIDIATMCSMPYEDYNTRLEAFKTYVEAHEQGLHFATDLVAGYEAYRTNTTSCPIQ